MTPEISLSLKSYSFYIHVRDMNFSIWNALVLLNFYNSFYQVLWFFKSFSFSPFIIRGIILPFVVVLIWGGGRMKVGLKRDAFFWVPYDSLPAWSFRQSYFSLRWDITYSYLSLILLHCFFFKLLLLLFVYLGFFSPQEKQKARNPELAWSGYNLCRGLTRAAVLSWLRWSLTLSKRSLLRSAMLA